MVEGSGRGGRAGRRRAGGAAAPNPLSSQAPFTQPILGLEPTKAVSEDELEAIHLASLRVLRETGIDFLNVEARAILAAHGADVDGDRVRFAPELIEAMVANAPAQFHLHARNPAHDLEIGGNHVAFASVASAPNVAGLDGPRRSGNRADYQNLLRLCQTFTSIHLVPGYPVEPIDVHASVRHLHATLDAYTLTDKVFHVYSLGRQRNHDAIEMTRIVRGVDQETFDVQPSLTTIINASSPLRYDDVMLEGVMEMSSRNQVVVITPFTLAGAMAPITLAGALVLQNAEALAGVAFTQMVRAGSPVVYGGFTSNVDMRSGAPAFGTPEYLRTAMVGGQLARRYGLPYRSSNVNAANAVDAQAAYESVFSLWGAVMGGVNLLMHGAGWMEGGLHTSYEKLAIDADVLHMVARALQPIIVDDATLAVEAIAEVGPAGHFFGSQHTQDRYRDEFYEPLISDWRNFEAWTEAGRPTAFDKANQLVKRALAEFEAPPLDDAVAAELSSFVERRVAEGGVETDF